MLVQTCQSKKKHREARVKEMLRITNETIDMDLLIGKSNMHKKATSVDMRTRIEQRFYSRRQAEEKVLLQALNVGAVGPQNLSLSNYNKRPMTGHLIPPHEQISSPNPSSLTAASFNTQLFYYNDSNNSDLKNLQNLNIKLQDDEDINKSRQLYASSVRASTRQPSYRSLKDEDIHNSFTHQKFGRSTYTSIYELGPNFSVENRALEESSDCNKSYLLVESPTLKGWSLNNGEHNKMDRVTPQKFSGRTGIGSARDNRIVKHSRSQSFSDDQSILSTLR